MHANRARFELEVMLKVALQQQGEALQVMHGNPAMVDAVNGAVRWIIVEAVVVGFERSGAGVEEVRVCLLA